MKLRPTIFLSGVSSEFASFRDAVEVEVQKKDCFPLHQPSFGVDHRTIEEILRRNIGEADAVIHIVGFRFGLEPQNRPEGKPRRSYTQMEYDIARELNKPVYVFLSADATVRDSGPGEQPEDAEAIQLQLAHRKALEQSNTIRYSFQNKNNLCLCAAGIPLLATADFRVDISRIDRYAPAELIGREDELKLLDDAWLKVRRAEPKRPHILTFVALGGEGKTSLVAKWLAKIAYEGWSGCDSAFAWSFYSQGTSDQSVAASDLFLKEAITFFGDGADKEFAASAAGPYEKGQRLARIVGQRCALLILDGLEPLQYAPTSSTPGALKDAGITALLKGLAAHSDGLCIVTTRYSFPNLKAFWQTTAPPIPLTRLSQVAGVNLLNTLGVKGSAKEFQTLVEDVKGHALTLIVLGTYLRDAHNGDIRRRDLVKLDEADAEEQSGHAFRVIEVYERALEKEGEKGKRALAILRLFGLFDRPISANSLGALIAEPTIPNLTDSLAGVTEVQLNLALNRLEHAQLLTINRERSGALVSLDAHPLLREYFAHQLRTQQIDAWHAAHRRLYEHLCASTPHQDEPTLEDLQPLYQAVAHGCHAGLQQKACEVYHNRIVRRRFNYSTEILGAFGSDLSAVAPFFETPWKGISADMEEPAQAWLLNQVATHLYALGRLTEAVEPMQDAIKMAIDQEDWTASAYGTMNLTEMELSLGEIDSALNHAACSVTYADRGGELGARMSCRVGDAYTLEQAGFRIEAGMLFREAERILSETESKTPLSPVMFSAVEYFWYCEFLLSEVYRSAWQCMLRRHMTPPSPERWTAPEPLFDVLNQVAIVLEIAKMNNWLLQTALGLLTLGRFKLYDAVFESGSRPVSRDSDLKTTLDDAVNSLRHSGYLNAIPYGLFTRAWLRFLNGTLTGSESAQEDLDEAWEIAERGPMRLHMADIHLYRARLFFREKEYPWEGAEADLAAARKLIEQCGYWLRKEELEDAERVILKKSA